MAIELDDKRQAILEAKGHILVQGGPGSGKTTIALLTARERVPHLLPGQKLLFLSFSRAAVRQVLSKCQEVLTYDERRAIEVRTYHAFCLEFLKSHGRLLMGKSPSFLYPTEERLRKSKYAGDWISEKRRLAVEENCFCFDMLAFGAAELLTRSEALRTLYAACYPMLIVDEFQDTDDQQWRIIKSLSSITSIFCLADPEQSIFQYRTEVSPLRIQEFQDATHPQTFDFGADNHRSPNGDILAFADAILKNQSPLPKSSDVKVSLYHTYSFREFVHEAVVWTADNLRSRGIESPTIAVLARSNAMVVTISNILNERHHFTGRVLEPVEHRVVWDEELSLAAAVVVASIMEWSAQNEKDSVSSTLRYISQYFDLKNAIDPSKAASQNSAKYLNAAHAVQGDNPFRLKAATKMLDIIRWISFTGDPMVDWRIANQILKDISTLQEISKHARMVRMFRATDTLGTGLSRIWRETGSYVGASSFVAKTLQSQQLESDERSDEPCLLMSIHKSKGKEFDGVILVEGHMSSFFFDTSEAPSFVQSRRLLRVGITRARSLVTILRSVNAMPLVNA